MSRSRPVNPEILLPTLFWLSAFCLTLLFLFESGLPSLSERMEQAFQAWAGLSPRNAYSPQLKSLVSIALGALMLATRFKKSLGAALLAFLSGLAAILAWNSIASRQEDLATALLPLITPAYLNLGLIFFMSYYDIAMKPLKAWHDLRFQQLSDETIEVQKNFLSLLSHNLNTPISKIFGIIEILRGLDPLEANREAIKVAIFHLTRLQLCARSVLQATAYERGNAAEPMTSIHLGQLAESLQEQAMLQLRNLGIDLDVQLELGEAELGYLPLYFDESRVNHLVSGLIWLLSQSERHGRWQLGLHCRQEQSARGDDSHAIELHFTCLGSRGLHQDPKELLAADLDTLSRTKFMDAIVIRHLQQIIQSYEGRFADSSSPAAFILLLKPAA